MKKNILFLSIALLFSVITYAQSFSYTNDSVTVIHQYNTPPGSDTTDILSLVNNGTTPLSLKVELHYEDVSPGFAVVEYFDTFPHQMMSNSGIGFTDSVIVQGSDSISFKAVFPSPGPQVINKVKLKVYDPLDSVNSYVILTFAEVICPAPSGNVIINPSGSYCSTDSVYLSANNNYTGYQWSTGDTAQTIYVPANNPVYIEASDSLGCVSKDTSNVLVSIPYEEQICIVSVDSATGKNIIVWEKTAMQGTDQFYVYKESFQAGVYNLIGFVDYDSLSVFIDVNSNPLQQPERYKISAVDTCGTESNKSSDHKTIHLTASIGTSNENNLVWDGYQGFSFPTYNIYRGPSPTSMSLLASVASTTFTYSDLTPLSGNNYYKIEAVRNSTCTPTQKATSYPSSVSNQVTLNPLGVGDLNGKNVLIYPNPTQGDIVINLGAVYTGVTVNVKDVVGATVMSNNYDAKSHLNIIIDKSPGIYFVEVLVDGKHLITKKILKN